MLSLDESRLLYGIGAILGVSSIAYFGQEMVLNLSPLVKAAVLLSSSGFFLVLPEYLSDRDLNIFLYVFSGFSYLSFLLYIFTVYGLTSEMIFGFLAASSAFFVFLGYWKSRGDFSLEESRARNLAWFLGMVAAVAVLFDVAGAQPEYGLELKDRVDLEAPGEFSVGELQVRNDFIFARKLDLPDFNGCIRGSGRSVNLYFDTESAQLIPGDSSLSFKIREAIRPHPRLNRSLSGSFPVYNRECGPGRGVYIWRDEDREPGLLD